MSAAARPAAGLTLAVTLLWPVPSSAQPPGGRTAIAWPARADFGSFAVPAASFPDTVSAAAGARERQRRDDSRRKA